MAFFISSHSDRNVRKAIILEVGKVIVNLFCAAVKVPEVESNQDVRVAQCEYSRQPLIPRKLLGKRSGFECSLFIFNI